ncbi:uncharacterized protein LODBEIA_P12840 [Lodderomyces beijingensis]|uniref:ATPase expression protein 2, mitochondrial n=1 Tax=Lodderomyces beijingensis TaxID=1775926 RepID=A0ABP0ZFV7_9ASCO
MNSLRSAITRIERSARSRIAYCNQTRPLAELVNTRNQAIHGGKEEEEVEPNNDQAWVPRDRQSRQFQAFLKPLGLKDLKINSRSQPFDSHSARLRWQNNNSKDYQIQSATYMDDRDLFENVLRCLVDLTPPGLKRKVTNQSQSQSKLKTGEEQRRRRHRVDIYHELPPIPSPLTKENFEEYIYKLTHWKYHFRNSSSLRSGIIPQILLHTHNLTNETYKPFRSATTFNYLIRYFGIEKNQSLFARNLILVMNQEGHLVNHQTIDLMLRICAIHSHIRSNTNTFILVLKYLRLGESLGISVSLDTWTRLYDTISNVRLKERFLRVCQQENIPMSSGLVMRILDDFMKVTTKTEDVIYFVENDLNLRESWRNDAFIKHKLISHQAKNGTVPEISADAYSLQHLLNGLSQNRNLSLRAKVMFDEYCKFCNRNRNSAPPQLLKIYTMLIKQLIVDFSDLRNAVSLVFVIRGLIHDATKNLGLPTGYCNGIEDERQSFPENYKIISRESKGSLFRLHALVEYIDINTKNENTKPWEPLRDEEVLEWLNFKNSSDKWDRFIQQQKHFIPENELIAIQKRLRMKSSKATNRKCDRVTFGEDDADFERVMRERGLIKENVTDSECDYETATPIESKRRAYTV